MVSVIKSEKQDDINILESSSIQPVNCFVKQDIKKECEDNIIFCENKDILTLEGDVGHYVEEPKNEPVNYGDLDSQSVTSLSLSEDIYMSSRNIECNNCFDSENKKIEAVYLKEEIDVKFQEISDEENSRQPSTKEAAIPYTSCDPVDFSNYYQRQNENLHHKIVHSESDRKYKSEKCGKNSHLNMRINAVCNNVKKYEYSVCNKMFSCDICCKRFSQKGLVAMHMKVHTGYRQYSCNTCSKRFSIKGRLTNHMKMHTCDRPYFCNICNKRFTWKGNLIEHMRVHIGHRPYSCNTCRKRFSTKWVLTMHMRVHTGDRPYCCNICSKTFSRNSGLIKHLRVHTGDRPYSCNICSKAFNQSNSLTYHMRMHTDDKPYNCNICSKTFRRNSNLTLHMRVHTGDRPYSCIICSKTFSRNSGLNKHLRVHTGERPYSCDICSKIYSERTSLTRHLRIHTGERP